MSPVHYKASCKRVPLAQQSDAFGKLWPVQKLTLILALLSSLPHFPSPQSFFFFLKLFIWLCLSWGTQDFHCIMRDLSLQCVDFVVSEIRLSCWVASGILVPQPGIKPTSLALQGGFLTTGPTGKSLIFKSLLNLLQYYFCFMFWPRDMWYLTIHTPCIARRILKHWPTRGVSWFPVISHPC